MCAFAQLLARKRPKPGNGHLAGPRMRIACLVRTNYWALGGAVAALVPFIGLLATDGRFLAGSDYPAFYVPFHDFAREELLACRFPLWMPYLTCGAALHAEQHATLLYPPAAPLVMALGANAGVKLAMFLHLTLCYMGQYLLARELRISRPGATFAALAGTWGTFAMDQLAAGHVTFVIGYAIIPWLLWLLLRVLARPTAARSAALAALVALFELGSHPQVLYYALLACTCWTAGWLVSPRAREKRLSALGWLTAAAVVAVLLSAAQWLPAIELVVDGSSEAERGKAAHAAMYSMDGADLARMLMPRFKGDELLGIEPFERHGYDHERGAYLGMIVLPLVLYGLSRVGAAPWQWGAAWVSVIAVEIALADRTPFWELFCSTVPGLIWFRCQGRIFSVISVVAPLLAARGLDALVVGEARGGWRTMWTLALLLTTAAAAAGDAMRRWLARVDWHQYLRYAAAHLSDEYVDWAAMLFAVSVVLLVCRACARELPAFAYVLAIAVLMGDLYEINVRHFQLVAPRGRWQVGLPKKSRPQRFVFLPSDLMAARISLQYSWAVPLAIGSRVPALNTNDGAVLPRAVSRLFSAVERNPVRALAVAGCDWAFIEPKQHWRELPGALPRFRFVRGAAASLCERPIEDCTDDDVAALREGLGGMYTVREEEPRHIEIEVDTPDDGMFVLADTFYPGWYATVDGQDAEIVPAHGVFRGVRLPAGKHRVAFLYDPWSFKLGCALSGCGLVGLVWMLWLAWRRHPRLRQPRTAAHGASIR